MAIGTSELTGLEMMLMNAVGQTSAIALIRPAAAHSLQGAVAGGVPEEGAGGGARTRDDAGVDVEEIVASHARLASDTGGHRDEIAALERGVQGLRVIRRPDERRELGLRTRNAVSAPPSPS